VQNSKAMPDLFTHQPNRIRGLYATELHAKRFIKRENDLINTIKYQASIIANYPLRLRQLSETIEEQRTEIAHLKNVIKLIKHK
jgi:hypothetical protein